MSGFQSNNALIKWIEYRLPIFGLMHKELVVYPTPRNLNYWDDRGAPEAHLAPRQDIAHEGRGHHGDQDQHPEDPQNFPRGLV